MKKLVFNRQSRSADFVRASVSRARSTARIGYGGYTVRSLDMKPVATVLEDGSVHGCSVRDRGTFHRRVLAIVLASGHEYTVEQRRGALAACRDIRLSGI